MQDQKILRLKITMKREKFLKYFDLKREDSLYVMLDAGYQQIRDVFCHYLSQLFSASGTHLPYLEAVRKIKWSALDDRTKEQMLFLVEKTSRGAGLDTAARKWAETYSIVGKRKLDNLMKTFDQINVNPITLETNEKGHISCLSEMILSALR